MSPTEVARDVILPCDRCKDGFHRAKVLVGWSNDEAAAEAFTQEDAERRVREMGPVLCHSCWSKEQEETDGSVR